MFYGTSNIETIPRENNVKSRSSRGRVCWLGEHAWRAGAAHGAHGGLAIGKGAREPPLCTGAGRAREAVLVVLARGCSAAPPVVLAPTPSWAHGRGSNCHSLPAGERETALFTGSRGYRPECQQCASHSAKFADNSDIDIDTVIALVLQNPADEPESYGSIHTWRPAERSANFFVWARKSRSAVQGLPLFYRKQPGFISVNSVLPSDVQKQLCPQVP